MRFLTKAKLKFESMDKEGVKWYTLKQNLIFDDDSEELIIVPKESFGTDIASVPKGLQFLFKPMGKYTASAILHDWLYGQKHLSRWHCDFIFYKAMKSQGVSFSVRFCFWSAVRLGGWADR